MFFLTDLQKSKLCGGFWRSPSCSRTASVLHYCPLRSQISFWKHKTSCWSPSACYWSHSLNLQELKYFKQCDGWRSVSSAHMHSLLTLDLWVYLGFHQFPLWICESFNIRREGNVTRCVMENGFLSESEVWLSAYSNNNSVCMLPYFIMTLKCAHNIC